MFSYRAYDNSGAKFEGELDATDKQGVIAELKSQGLLASEIKPVVQKGQGILLFSRGVTLADLEFLTAELSLLLASGVRIDRGIDIIRRNKAKPVLANLLGDISKDIKGGSSLAESVRKHPKVFSPLYCNLVELGESSGNLVQVFHDLAVDLKFSRDLQSKIISSLTYPLVILFVCILSIFFVFNFIIPRMSSMFDGVDNLPWYTSALLSASEWLNNYQGLLFIGILIGGVGIYVLFKRPEVKHWFAGISLSLPVIKSAVITVERIRFNSGIALMLSAGLAIDKALSLCIGNVSNHHLKRELEIARDKVKRGNSLSQALRQTSIYPAFFISLLEVGEESGNLESVFSEIAKRSKQEFESWTGRITTLLEPLMILFMGGLVGGIVIIMLLSMVSINEFGV
ncbi:type II secretion system F family protein [uncultured Paraglaciecola sp.]|uniref:type II secretion system F family protein n=1 Tax=uncultured Paraglaciecola sp. TaxID=1765024 RepID=UPI0025EFF885|nr:type II secretion system F family protein [uncultured Paraglaciecola sp.]